MILITIWVGGIKKDMSFTPLSRIQKTRLKITYRMLNGRIGSQEDLVEVKGMSFSENESKDFFEAWRFEECPDLMKAIECGDIVLFNKEQSRVLWSMLISSSKRHLMEMDMNIFSKIDHYDIDFDRKESANELFLKFDELSGYPQFVFLFFSEQYLCITPYYLLKKYWNYYFLPSDETTIITTIKNNHFLFSYEERFFIVTR